jgi:LCP family protein required for cell wall assembly
MTDKEQRPYMPTPDEYVTALGGDGQLPTQKPVREKRPRHWKRVLVGVLLVLLVGVLGYGVYIASIVAKISTQPLDMTQLSRDSSGRTNVLILGIGDPGHAGEALTDTMMVLSYDIPGQRIAQISIPRDLRVNIPDFGYAKINAANVYGGTKLAEQTVSNTLGIPIHYFVQTDFSGLVGLVDAVGGIDVNVKDRLVDTEYPCDDNQYKSCGLDIEPGLQHMDGAKTLKYVRCRKGTCGNDFGRAARQQEVIGLVRDKMVKLQNLINPAVLIPMVEALHKGLKTDMGTIQLLQLADGWQKAKANQPVNLVFSTAPGGYLKDASGSSDLLPQDGTFEAIQNRVKNIFTTPVDVVK